MTTLFSSPYPIDLSIYSSLLPLLLPYSSSSSCNTALIPPPLSSCPSSHPPSPSSCSFPTSSLPPSNLPPSYSFHPPSSSFPLLEEPLNLLDFRAFDLESESEDFSKEELMIMVNKLLEERVEIVRVLGKVEEERKVRKNNIFKFWEKQIEIS